RAIRQATGNASPLLTSPAVLAHRALLAVEDGDVVAADEALAALSAVEDDGTDARITSLRKLAALHRARLAADLATAHASDLVEGATPAHLPQGLDADVRVLVLADRGALRLFEGDHAGAREDLRSATDLATAGGLDSVRLYCTTLLAGAYLAANDDRAARAAAEDAICFSTRLGWQRTPTMAYSYALGGWASFQLLEPDTAADFAAIALDVIDTTIDVELEGAARAIAAIISFEDPLQRRVALGRLQRATAWLAERGGSPSLAAMLAPHELRMCLELGEWRLADRCVERAEKRLGHNGDVAVMQAQLTTARGRPGDAHRLLGPVLTGELTPLRSTATTAAWLLEALLATRADRNPAATEAMLAALDAANGTATLRPFMDAGAEVHLLLAGLVSRSGHLEGALHDALTGIKRVIRWQEAARAAQGDVPGSGGTRTARYLTDRELAFLRELPSMMTLAEIAETHGVSINTAKTHVRSIYTKLGASTRREAIGIGRALELL
ncbi:MAG TPA: LuxR C-terminal-related transcriptional regulator, partial [Mycobacterium sp.]|nr:LuxR C-terminal-related transcriptional regulator [Mycobacterium sp.]